MVVESSAGGRSSYGIGSMRGVVTCMQVWYGMCMCGLGLRKEGM